MKILFLLVMLGLVAGVLLSDVVLITLSAVSLSVLAVDLLVKKLEPTMIEA
ncbi:MULTISPECIES: hypothetical protein [Pseudomonas]|uniref:Uncharacterized protein n=1 Tax=Pseudomonas chlororaphis TaxID=587753 RepID=A0AAX3FTR9_9PSED|nr:MULTISPECIES: hypothetical protein [Pseudomonas]AZC39422.1 hypothetical protein C4K37_5057 [Pseudomonas chlororaphis subsp. piscium]AZC45974.1 hypothetical protein C4K36_5071 [Pseudomonas chlororaphis subsp. piscium]AZC83967.1 hypothetical protein C4K30_4875 [Pseudomonas chlororaphis subsp. piscium]WDG71508.1 hypothetical protein PUP65_25900 [Pseudomonas chlororaphis]WDH30708.1 hypothetical protein PUP81_08420 [Pseudomonas chlororaphis]